MTIGCQCFCLCDAITACWCCHYYYSQVFIKLWICRCHQYVWFLHCFPFSPVVNTFSRVSLFRIITHPFSYSLNAITSSCFTPFCPHLSSSSFSFSYFYYFIFLPFCLSFTFTLSSDKMIRFEFPVGNESRK